MSRSPSPTADAPTPLEFWFDFSSPYAYFASLSVERVAAKHGRAVLWRPFMLGVAFKRTGMGPLSKTPLRGDYARHDWARLARREQVPFRLPPNHPITALPASRAFYWLERHQPELAPRFAKAAFRAYFADNADLTQPQGAADLAATLGCDRDQVLRGIGDPAIKALFTSMTAEGLAKGVFGSPFFLVDGEPFWGADRLPMLDEWLSRGGW